MQSRGLSRVSFNTIVQKHQLFGAQVSLPLAPPGKPAYKEVVVGQLLSRVRLFATPWTVAHPASPSMGFSRQEYWSGLPFPSPGDLPDPGIEPGSPALEADSLTSEPQGSYEDE